MKVQRIRLPETDEVSWIVLDDGYLPIEPIQAYLAFLVRVSLAGITSKSKREAGCTTFLPIWKG